MSWGAGFDDSWDYSRQGYELLEPIQRRNAFHLDAKLYLCFWPKFSLRISIRCEVSTTVRTTSSMHSGLLMRYVCCNQSADGDC